MVPLVSPEVPEFSFQQAVDDFVVIHGKDIIYADQYTGWVEVALKTVYDINRTKFHLKKIDLVSYSARAEGLLKKCGGA